MDVIRVQRECRPRISPTGCSPRHLQDRHVCDLQQESWVQVDLTYAVAKFLVEQARGNTHAPASPREENGLLIYNYQTTFTGKVTPVRMPQLCDPLPCMLGWANAQLAAGCSRNAATWQASLKVLP